MSSFAVQVLIHSRIILERKRRAIPPSSFGQALTALLDTSTSRPHAKQEPSLAERPPLLTHAQTTLDTAVLALKRTSLAKRKRAEGKNEEKAAKTQLNERREREERNRMTDVIGGWGGESERALRKVAQRGGMLL